MSKEEESSGLGWLLVTICTVALFAFVGWILVTADMNEEERHQFEGVCEYLEGTVEGDVCVKDGKVVHSK